MEESDGEKHRIAGFRWYHWLIVVAYSVDQAMAAAHLGLGGIIASGGGAFIGAFVTVWILRAIWHTIGPYYRTTDGDQTEKPVDHTNPSK